MTPGNNPEAFIQNDNHTWLSLLENKTREDWIESSNKILLRLFTKTHPLIMGRNDFRSCACSPRTFWTPFLRDTGKKRSTEGGYMQFIEQGRSRTDMKHLSGGQKPQFSTMVSPFPNKCRIQRKNTLQNRGTNPKALRICTNFNSENYINRHPRANHRLRNFRKNYG